MRLENNEGNVKVENSCLKYLILILSSLLPTTRALSFTDQFPIWSRRVRPAPVHQTNWLVHLSASSPSLSVEVHAPSVQPIRRNPSPPEVHKIWCCGKVCTARRSLLRSDCLLATGERETGRKPTFSGQAADPYPSQPPFQTTSPIEIRYAWAEDIRGAETPRSPP